MDKISERHERFFSQPQGLSKLALFLLRAMRASGKWKGRAERPFVLGATNSRTNTVLLVGVPCSERGLVKRNQFGTAFRNAATSINAHFKHDRFETSVMEIEYEDRNRFIESLHLTMRSQQSK